MVLAGVVGALLGCAAAFLVVLPDSDGRAFAVAVTVGSGAVVGLVVGAIWRKEGLKWLAELFLNL